MKIAFIVHEYNRHIGHARYVAELASRFKAGHEVHVFTSEWEEPDPEGITFHHVPSWRWRTLTSVLTSIIPSTLMVGGGFDIIHAQGLCGFRQDVSTAHFIQTCWLESLRGQGVSLGLSTWVWRWVVAPLERLSLSRRLCRRVIAISGRVREDLGTRYRRIEGVDLVYHGVDLARFHPENRARFRIPMREGLGVGPSDFLALFVGNLQKGAVPAIRALALVPGARLLVVSGSNNERERAIASDLGVADRVLWQPLSREIERFYACADCFIFPTLYEPYGMVISEAMASGLPVVTSRRAGAAELISHGNSGWLLEEPWDPACIAEGLLAVASDPTLATGMGTEARRSIEPYTWDRCADETMAVYEAVLLEKQGTRKP